MPEATLPVTPVTGPGALVQGPGPGVLVPIVNATGADDGPAPAALMPVTLT